MVTEVLGKLSFVDTPSVSGLDVLLNAGGTPSIMTDITANRPAFGTAGRLFFDLTLFKFFRDSGAAWTDLSSLPSISGTANQITMTAGTAGSTPTVASITTDPIIPGTGRIRIPTGTTAQRVTAAVGDIRYNSTTSKYEKYSGVYWAPLGVVLQQVTGAIAAVTGTTTNAFTTALPLITAGTTIWTTSFTPISTTSRIIIEFTTLVAASVATRTIVTNVFFGATPIGSSAAYLATTNVPSNIPIYLTYAPASVATVTVQARMGQDGTTGTWYCNNTSTATLGGALVSQYTITEIQP